MPLFSAAALAISGAGSAYAANQNRKAQAAANQATADLSDKQNIWNAEQAGYARDFEAIQAQKQMDFQEAANAKAMAFSAQQAATQHQREVADLRAAGLNPILSGTGGMGSAAPSGVTSAGAMARGTSATGNKVQMQAFQQPDYMATAISSALSTARTLADVKKTEAETEEVKARTPTYEVQIQKAEQEIRESASRVGLNAALEDKSVQEVNQIYQSIARMAVEMDLTKAQTRETLSRIPTNQALAGKYGAETAVAAETERSMLTDRYLRKKVGDLEKADLPPVLSDIPIELIKGLLFRFIK